MWNIQLMTGDLDEQSGFLQSYNIYIEASLKLSLCSTQDLGATGEGEHLQNFQC